MGLFDIFKGRPKEAKKAEEVKLEEIGVITHFFPHVKAAVIKLSKKPLKVGDSIYIKGHTTDFKQPVKSLQFNHAPIQEAKAGQEVGVKVKARVRIGDVVYKA